jgi:hypothetical protein
VPGVDISVTGYDDLEEAAIATPALTTVWNGQPEVGRRAARALLDRIDGVKDQSGTLELIRPELHIRQSTSPVRERADMTENPKSVTVAMPSRFNPRAAERIGAEFDAISFDRPDPALVPDGRLEQVRGLAGFLNPSYIPLIDALPNLEVIANFGVGYDPKSSLHAVEKGICVTHTPSVLDEEVADTALALLLNTVREFYPAEKWLRDGRWTKDGDYRLTPLTLRDRTVGIYGLGASARRSPGASRRSD